MSSTGIVQAFEAAMFFGSEFGVRCSHVIQTGPNHVINAKPNQARKRRTTKRSPEFRSTKKKDVLNSLDGLLQDRIHARHTHASSLFPLSSVIVSDDSTAERSRCGTFTPRRRCRFRRTVSFRLRCFRCYDDAAAVRSWTCGVRWRIGGLQWWI